MKCADDGVSSFQALGFVRKKVRTVAREASTRATAHFLTQLAGFTTDQLCFMDEVHADDRNRNRQFGWARKGHRVSTRGFFVRHVRYSTVALMHHTGVLSKLTVPESTTSSHMRIFAQHGIVSLRHSFYSARCLVVMTCCG